MFKKFLLSPKLTVKKYKFKEKHLKKICSPMVKININSSDKLHFKIKTLSINEVANNQT